MAATAAAVDDNDNHVVGIGNSHLAVTVHILGNRNCRVTDDLEEVFPNLCRFIDVDTFRQDMQPGMAKHATVIKQAVIGNSRWCFR